MLGWVLEGQTEFDIGEAVRAQWPDQDARPLIVAVMESLTLAADCEPRVVLGWAFEATRDVYRRMLAVADYAGAMRAIRQIVELTRHVPDQPEAEQPAEAGGEAQPEQPAEQAGGGQVPEEEATRGREEPGAVNGGPGNRPAARRRRPPA